MVGRALDGGPGHFVGDEGIAVARSCEHADARRRPDISCLAFDDHPDVGPPPVGRQREGRRRYSALRERHQRVAQTRGGTGTVVPPSVGPIGKRTREVVR